MKWSSSGCGGNSHGRAYSVGGRTLITESSYPSGGRTSGDGYSGTMSSGGGVGSSYVATNHDLRIRNVYKALADGEEWKPGAYYGCQGDNSRKNKETDGLSSPLKYIINEIKIYNGFHPVKGFVFSDCNLTARDMEYLSSNLPSINHTFELVDFSHNPQIGPLGFDYLIKGAPGIVSLQSGNHDINLMYQGMLTRPGFNTVKLDLSNCNIGDIGADILGHALASGKLPATKKIDVSGNQITQEGDTKIVQALKSDAVQDIIVLTQRLDSNSRLIFGSKEEKKVELKKFIQLGKEKGVDSDHIVVDTSFLGKIKNTLDGLQVVKIASVGFSKCKWTPENVAVGYAQDKLMAKTPSKIGNYLKSIGKLFDIKETLSCYLDATDNAWSSETGLQVVNHELCVMGEQEFCSE